MREQFCPFAKGQSNEELTKPEFFQKPHPLSEEDSLVADAALLRIPKNQSVAGIMLPVTVQSKNEQRIEQLVPCWKNISTCITCASSMSCRSCQLMGRSRSNPVHINHQYRREGRHAGVSQ